MRCVTTRVTPPRHPRVYARVRRMARSPRAHTRLIASFTGVRVRTTRTPRGSSFWVLARRSTSASRPTRCGFVRSGLFSTSSIHLFITFAFRFWFFAFRSKGRSAGRCCAGGWCVARAIAIPESSVKDSSLGNITHNLNCLTYIGTPGRLLTTPGQGDHVSK